MISNRLRNSNREKDLAEQLTKMEKVNKLLEYASQHYGKFIARGIFEPGYVIRTACNTKIEWIAGAITAEAMRFGAYGYLAYQIYKTIN